MKNLCYLENSPYEMDVFAIWINTQWLGVMFPGWDKNAT